MLRIAIVGAGIMGANHARLAAGMLDTEVAYVVDADAARAQRLAESVGAKPVAALDEVLGQVDAAVVAVPTEQHAPIAIRLAEAGVHVLVEKPLAPTSTEAATIVEAADRAGVVLMPGHVERFNPAVLELSSVAADVLHIGASRISPFSPRVRDDVVLDLMIHDLDIVRSLVGRSVAEVHALTQSVRTDAPDLACALLTFEGGSTASLVASRIGQQKIRELRITLPESFVTVDLVRQDLTVNRVDHSEFLSAEGARYRQRGVVEIPFLEHRGEPIQLELAEFLRAVATGTTPRVTGTDGVEAIRLCERVLAAA